MNDLKFAFRQLLKNPGFTAVAVVTLALGIGVNTSMVTALEALINRSLPYSDPATLVQVFQSSPGSTRESHHSAPDFLDYQASGTFEYMAALNDRQFSLVEPGQPAERVRGLLVSADLFPLLGIQPEPGRNFSREEDTPNGPKTAILGHGLWQSRFGGDANVLGRTITLNEQSYTVVGVLPASFQYPEGFQLWTPLALGETGGTFVTYGEGMWLLKAIARLKPGVTREQAQAELRTIAQRIQPSGPAATPRGIGANTAIAGLAPTSGRANGQGLIDLDLRSRAVEAQNLRRIQNLDANQLVRGSIIEKDILVGLDGCHFAALFGQVDVSGVHFGIVGDFHKLWLKIERQDRNHHVSVRLLGHDGHHLFGAIVFAFPGLFKPQVKPISGLPFLCRNLTSAPNGFLDLLPVRAPLDHSLDDMNAEIDRLHDLGLTEMPWQPLSPNRKSQI